MNRLLEEVQKFGLPLSLFFFLGCGSSDSSAIKNQDPLVQKILKDPSSTNSIDFKTDDSSDANVDQKDLIKNYGDVLRSSMHSKKIKYNREVMEALEDPRLSAVTTEFGKTKINLKNLPYESPVIQADVKAWSSWWFPDFKKELFEDTIEELSPLKKYDVYSKYRMGKISKAAQFERENLYHAGARDWFGRCDAWSWAAIYRPEPQGPIFRQIQLSDETSRDLKFTVGDQKALLIKSFEQIDQDRIKIYGQRFTQSETGWLLPDMYADEMFRFVQVWLFQKHKAFVMDHDLKNENWNVPVHSGFFKMEKATDYPDSVKVYLALTSPLPTDDSDPQYLNFVGSKETTREYYFILHGTPDGDWLTVDDGFYIKGGVLVNSRTQHPDYFEVILDPETANHWSSNEEVDVKVVDQILYGKPFEPSMLVKRAPRSEGQEIEERAMYEVTR